MPIEKPCKLAASISTRANNSSADHCFQNHPCLDTLRREAPFANPIQNQKNRRKKTSHGSAGCAL